MSELPETESDFDPTEQPTRTWLGKMGLALTCIGVIGLLLIGAWWFNRAIYAASSATLNSDCTNNMKHLSNAFLEYREEHGSFPPAYIADETGRPMHSWRVLLLPYLDEQELYDQYNFDEPWDGPNNSKLADRMPKIYRCRGYQEHCDEHGLDLPWLTNYVVITHPDGIFDGERKTTAEEITDEPGQTILFTEVRQHAVHWMQPVDVTLPELMLDLQFTRLRKHSNHGDHLNMFMADGHRKSFRANDTTAADLHKRVTRDGGEPLDE